ncbi:DUF305 domain-containing protein [Peterkaempfera griseoplana]|uniref:DUF305 domain-containing protein n=1 Tax=Peterkaempfera griseoplana TaxID=66896 RepID=UPI0006E23C62|nr:DUF305 domain-containing protein [Peterkaempfera griseoplana]
MWWPAVVAGFAALCVGALALVIGTSGGSPAVAGDRASAAAAPADGSPEAGFARDMSVHHQQAVNMSFIVRDRTQDPEVRLLAFDIINTQANQRGMMSGWLDQWGLAQTSTAKPMAWMGMGDDYQAHDGSLMPGMATNAQLDQLRKASGKAAEVLYLQLMIEHHKGGVHMAQGYVAMSHNAVEKRLAQTMVAGQTSEIKLMTDMLKARGAKPLG